MNICFSKGVGARDAPMRRISSDDRWEGREKIPDTPLDISLIRY